MTLTLNPTPEVEAGLIAQARAAGLPIDEFLKRQLEGLMHGAPSPAPLRASVEQWDRELDEWLDSFPQQPVLSDEATSVRAGIPIAGKVHSR